MRNNVHEKVFEDGAQWQRFASITDQRFEGKLYLSRPPLINEEHLTFKTKMTLIYQSEPSIWSN